jgi:hypothetical protein
MGGKLNANQGAGKCRDGVKNLKKSEDIFLHIRDIHHSRHFGQPLILGDCHHLSRLKFVPVYSILDGLGKDIITIRMNNSRKCAHGR